MAGQDKGKPAAAAAAAKRFEKSYFDVLGLCCSSEVPLIENILKPLEGVKEVSVIVPSKTVIVVHETLLISQIQIVKALNQARLEANVRVYGQEESYKRKLPSPYAIASGVLLLLSFLKYVYRPLGWFALGAVVVGIFPILMKGFTAVRNLRFHDINILVIIAVIGTIVLGDYLEAGTIVFLFTIAEWLESRAGHRAKAVMSSLMSMAPQKAVLAENGDVVDVDEVKLNTILAVKAGEVIPIDGIVVEGKGEVDEKTLTGESYPVAKEKDSTVWAGTINLNGYLSVKTTALAEDCAVAKMAKLVEEAQNSKTRTQRFIDKCTKFYTPAVLIISFSIAVIPAALRVHDYWGRWFHLALVVLVSACPCALILSTPVVTFCALTKAATSGLLIKGGDYIELLAKVKIMAFDKTGTITSGEFVVVDFQSLRDDISLNTLVYWVASIERKSNHPMADALIEYGRSLSIELKPEIVEEFQNFPGEGICGKIDGQDIYIGNRKLALRVGCETVPTIKGAKGGKSIGYIYCGGSPAGIFTISDSCRSGAAEAVRELKKLGIKTAMLTGDSHAAALHTNEQLKQGLEAVHAELLPEDKARIIEEFKTEGKTAMVGDGINDAPALATADIGISMGISGSALAQETGNIILLSNDIRKLPKAVKLARRANRKVIENVALSIITKAAILALGFAGHPLVWAAVLADVGTCMLVIFNSMLLLQGTDNPRAPHAHKHGRKGHSHSHKNQNCCSDNSKAVKACDKPQRCSSQKCGSECQPNPLNSSLPGKHMCNDDLHEAHLDLESQKKDNHSCLSPHNLSSCAEGDKLHEPKHCHHSSAAEENRKLTSKGHCHSTHCGKEHDRHKEDDRLHEETRKLTSVGHCHSSHCGQEHKGKEDEGHHGGKHCNHASLPLQESQKLTSTGHCHSSHCGQEHKRKEDEGHHEDKHCNHASLPLQESQKLTSTGHCHSSHCGQEHKRKEDEEHREDKHCNHASLPLQETQKLTNTGHCRSSHCGQKHKRKEHEGQHWGKHCNHASLPLHESRKLTSAGHCHSSHCGQEHKRKEDERLHKGKHCNHASLPLQDTQKLTSIGHCHSNHCGEEHNRNDTLAKMLGASFDHEEQHHLHEEIPHHMAIDIEQGSENAESVLMHSCMGSGDENQRCCSESVAIHACVLEKREVGGCCRSYMKECCGGHGHGHGHGHAPGRIGSSFSGALSEITIE